MNILVCNLRKNEYLKLQNYYVMSMSLSCYVIICNPDHAH